MVNSVVRGAEPAKPATTTTAAATTRANAKPGLAVIGCGGIAKFHGQYLPKYCDVVAVCEVDRNHANSYNHDIAGGKAAVTGHYAEVLARKDVDLVLIATPDHWHSKIAADAMRAGKDLYCEKPLTLTIDEGRLLCRVARQTSRVFQVGTQQRSDEHFLKAVALAHAGRLGKIRHVTVAIGDTPPGAGFKSEPPPPELDWDTWLGQAPKTEYIKQRCHFDFRWWYEYSGGRLTDWGAHHVDIAQWAAAPDLPGPTMIEPLDAQPPVPYERGYPKVHNAFNTFGKFNLMFSFANGVDIFVRDRVDGFPSDNGILIEGDGGFLFVNRDTLTGPAVDQLKDNPLPVGALRPLDLSLKMPHERHFANFIECVKTRQTPASDVWTHTRNLTTLHLGNIAMRVGRKLR